MSNDRKTALTSLSSRLAMSENELQSEIKSLKEQLEELKRG